MSVSLRKQLVLLLVIILAGILIASTYYVVVLYKEKDTRSDIVRTFEGTALTLENGESLDIARFGTNPVVVISWATWCPLCTDALWMFSRVKETYGDKVVVVAVNRKEEASIVEDYRDSVGLPKNIVFVNDTADGYFKNVDGRSMPEILFYDRNGTLATHLIAPPSEAELDALLANLLPE